MVILLQSEECTEQKTSHVNGQVNPPPPKQPNGNFSLRIVDWQDIISRHYAQKTNMFILHTHAATGFETRSEPHTNTFCTDQHELGVDGCGNSLFISIEPHPLTADAALTADVVLTNVERTVVTSFEVRDIPEETETTEANSYIPTPFQAQSSTLSPAAPQIRQNKVVPDFFHYPPPGENGECSQYVKDYDRQLYRAGGINSTFHQCNKSTCCEMQKAVSAATNRCPCPRAVSTAGE